nr:hypothetical protein CoNPh37_CDS0082 [Staphylococcus phage S-CoN_Ph37]
MTNPLRYSAVTIYFTLCIETFLILINFVFMIFFTRRCPDYSFYHSIKYFIVLFRVYLNI